MSKNNSRFIKYFLILIEFIVFFSIGSITGLWGLTIMVEIDLSEIPREIIKNYSLIALTLFGFTLIGGIFEKGKNAEKQLPVVRNLFIISLGFLFSAMTFLLSSTLYGVENLTSFYRVICENSLILGVYIFTASILLMTYVLIRHLIVIAFDSKS